MKIGLAGKVLPLALCLLALGLILAGNCLVIEISLRNFRFICNGGAGGQAIAVRLAAIVLALGGHALLELLQQQLILRVVIALQVAGPTNGHIHIAWHRNHISLSKQQRAAARNSRGMENLTQPHLANVKLARHSSSQLVCE